MIIENGKVVSIEYTLKDAEGEVLDTTNGVGPLDYVHGMQALIPGLEKELAGKSVGDAFSVEVEPAEAYGEFSEELVIEVPKANFPSDVEIAVGMQFIADGGRTVTVVELKDDMVKIDANHPLAGEKLFFDIKIADIRDATEEELSLGFGGGCGSCNCGDGGCSSGSCGDGGCGCGGSCGC